MIILTDEQSDKIDLIDTFFNSIPIEKLKEIAESENIVSVLKGKEKNQSVLRGIIQDYSMMTIEVSTLKVEMSAMKNDFHVLTKLVLRPNEYNSHSDAIALKNKYNVY